MKSGHNKLSAQQNKCCSLSHSPPTNNEQSWLDSGQLSFVSRPLRQLRQSRQSATSASISRHLELKFGCRNPSDDTCRVLQPQSFLINNSEKLLGCWNQLNPDRLATILNRNLMKFVIRKKIRLQKPIWWYLSGSATSDFLNQQLWEIAWLLKPTESQRSGSATLKFDPHRPNTKIPRNWVAETNLIRKVGFCNLGACQFSG